MAELVDDELEPVIDQAAARLRTLELELVDDAEEWLAIVGEWRGLWSAYPDRITTG